MTVSAVTIDAALLAVPTRTFAPALRKLRLVLAEPRCPPALVAAIFASDPALVALLLARAAFARHPSQPPVLSIGHAIMDIGMGGVAGLAEEALPLEAHLVRHLAGCWSMASATGLFARLLRVHCHCDALKRRVDDDTVYVSGLLHDLGTIAAVTLFGSPYARAGRRLVDGEGPLADLVAEELGVATDTLGARYARLQGLPAPIPEVCGSYRRPHQAPRHRELAALIKVARNVVIGCGFCSGLDQFVDTIHDEELELLGLRLGGISRALDDFFERVDELEQYEAYLVRS